MGETRVKKTSKRTLKAQTETNGKTSTVPERLQPVSQTVSPKVSDSSLQPHRDPVLLDGTFDNRSLIETREIEGRGIGLFAVRTIPRGTLVLVEIPVIRVTTIEEADESSLESVFQDKFTVLSKAERKRFTKLHDSHKANFSQIRSIYHTNCYNLAKPRSELGGSCLGLLASRINHSCVPNVQFSFLESIPSQLMPRLATQIEGSVNPSDTEQRGVMQFYAMKRIQRGHEILSNYESIYLTSQQRQRVMQFHYGFTCDCKACVSGDNPFWLKSDTRRRELIKLKTDLASLDSMWKIQHGPTTLIDSSIRLMQNVPLEGAAKTAADEAMTILRRVVELLELEGLTGIDLVNAYHKLVKWSRRGGAEDIIIQRWEGLEREAIVAAFGTNSPRLHSAGHEVEDGIRTSGQDRIEVQY